MNDWTRPAQGWAIYRLPFPSARRIAAPVTGVCHFNIGDIFYTLRGDGGQLEIDAQKAAQAAGVKGGQAFSAGLGMGVGVEAIGAATGMVKTAFQDLIGGSVAAASDLNETLNKTKVVFGGASEEVIRFGETASDTLGLSETKALDAAGSFGALFKSMGMGVGPTKDMSLGLVQLSADLASFYNKDPTDVLEALRSGIIGESEPMRQFGVMIDAASVKQEALRLGLVKGNEELTAAQKAQATYSLILAQTTVAQGDFANTSTGLANQQRILAAQWEDLQAKIGAGLLPVMQGAVGFLNDSGIPAIEFLIQNGDKLQPMLISVAGAITIAAVPALKELGVAAWEATGPLGAIALGLGGIATAVNTVMPQTSMAEEKFRALRQGVIGSAGALGQLRENLLKNGKPMSDLDRLIVQDTELMGKMGLVYDKTTDTIKTQAEAQHDYEKTVNDAAMTRWAAAGKAAAAAQSVADAEKTAGADSVRYVRTSMAEIAATIRQGKQAIVSAASDAVDAQTRAQEIGYELQLNAIETAEIRKQMANKASWAKLSAADRIAQQQRLLELQSNHTKLLFEQATYGTKAEQQAKLTALLQSKEMRDGLSDENPDVANMWRDLQTKMQTALDGMVTTTAERGTEMFTGFNQNFGSPANQATWKTTIGWYQSWLDSLHTPQLGPPSFNKGGGGGGKPPMKLAAGMDFVPYDGFPALLHRGEAVLTRREADSYRAGDRNVTVNVAGLVKAETPDDIARALRRLD